MTANDVFLLVVRWIHLTASAAWVGGSIFYLLVLRPAVRGGNESGRLVNQRAAAEFRVLVDVCFFLVLVTGISLTFDRLSAGVTGAAYVGVLGVKVALSVWMFVLARRRRSRAALLDAYRERPDEPSGALQRVARALSGYNMVVILGVIVFLLADLLKTLFEMALR